jgi:uncharacterized membrane protein YfcA
MLIYLCIIASVVWRFVQAATDRTAQAILPAGYFPLTAGISIGFAIGWMKSGGVSNHPTFFLLLALLLIPSQLVSASSADAPDRYFRSGIEDPGASDALR